jgi:hypothetical protein
MSGQTVHKKKGIYKMAPNYRISGEVFSSFHSHEGITAREALPLEPAKSWDLRASERIGNRIPDSDTAG